MTSKPLWENAQPIVSAVRQLLLDGKILPYEPNAYGWQGVGVEMQLLIEDLKAEIERKEFKVCPRFLLPGDCLRCRLKNVSFSTSISAGRLIIPPNAS
jgi:hypothetical protein